MTEYLKTRKRKRVRAHIRNVRLQGRNTYVYEQTKKVELKTLISNQLKPYNLPTLTFCPQNMSATKCKVVQMCDIRLERRDETGFCVASRCIPRAVDLRRSPTIMVKYTDVEGRSYYWSSVKQLSVYMALLIFYFTINL